METKILLTKKKYEKNPKTKTTYKLISTESEIITLDQYEDYTNTRTTFFLNSKEVLITTKEQYQNCKYLKCKYQSHRMERLKYWGGIFKRQFAITRQGYRCVKTVSVCIDKQKKKVYEYKFL